MNKPELQIAMSDDTWRRLRLLVREHGLFSLRAEVDRLEAARLAALPSGDVVDLESRRPK